MIQIFKAAAVKTQRKPCRRLSLRDPLLVALPSLRVVSDKVNRTTFLHSRRERIRWPLRCQMGPLSNRKTVSSLTTFQPQLPRPTWSTVQPVHQANPFSLHSPPKRKADTREPKAPSETRTIYQLLPTPA